MFRTLRKIRFQYRKRRYGTYTGSSWGSSSARYVRKNKKHRYYDTWGA